MTEKPLTETERQAMGIPQSKLDNFPLAEFSGSVLKQMHAHGIGEAAVIVIAMDTNTGEMARTSNLNSEDCDRVLQFLAQTTPDKTGVKEVEV